MLLPLLSPPVDLVAVVVVVAVDVAVAVVRAAREVRFYLDDGVATVDAGLLIAVVDCCVTVDVVAAAIDVVGVAFIVVVVVASRGQVLRRSDGEGDSRAPDARQRQPGPRRSEQMVLMTMATTTMLPITTLTGGGDAIAVIMSQK